MIRQALLLALPFIAACTTLSDAGADLAGTKWAFTSIDGARPVSAKASLTFETDRLGANVGCNGMGSAWELAKGKLVAGPIISTMMYCDGLMEQERAVAALLEGKPDVVQTGDRLTLRSAAHSAELQRVN